MARPSEAHVDVARRLLAQERAGVGTANERAAAAGRVYGRLFGSIAPIVGAAGFRALFTRSLKLSAAGLPCLGEVRTIAEPPKHDEQIVQQLVSCLSKLEAAAASEVATSLYATFFGIMATFIGDRLVWQILKRTFPTLDETGPKETE